MRLNEWWYAIVRDYEAKTFQFTSTFFTSQEPSKTSETRMHYTMRCKVSLVTFHPGQNYEIEYTL